jgi:hypothetical protein
MTVNTGFNQQSTAHPVAGGYVQPSAGVTGALVCVTDPSGNALKSVGASSGTTYAGVAQYRDAAVSAMIGSATTAGPTAATVVATVTPGTAGIWEIQATVSISGASAVAVESNNMALYQTAAAKIALIPYASTTTGTAAPVNIPPFLLNLGASDTVNIKVLANATGTAIYAAAIYCRLVG